MIGAEENPKGTRSQAVKIHPVEEGMMNRNRILFSLVALVLLAMAALTIRGALATSANVSTAIAVSPGLANLPELNNASAAVNPAGYWNVVTSNSSGLVQKVPKAPEMYNSQAPSMGGYWNSVSSTAAGMIREAARPPELYDGEMTRDLAGYWRTVAQPAK